MITETGHHAFSEVTANRAVYDLGILRSQLTERGIGIDSKPDLDHPVDNAIDNLNFIYGEIIPIISNFIQARKPTRNLRFSPLVTLSEVFFDPRFQRLQIHAPKMGRDVDMDLNPDSLKSLWDENLSRQSVDILANLTKERILQKFEKYIKKNI